MSDLLYGIAAVIGASGIFVYLCARAIAIVSRCEGCE